MTTPAFRHVDHDRTIVFGPGAVEAAADLIGEGYTLLTTPRAAEAVPALVARAGARVDVPGGLVDEIATDLRGQVPGERYVALGGGRVVDVAKALAAADGPRTVIAVPTTLSGAEMTGSHRMPRGVPAGIPTKRADVVVNDPALSASHDVAGLAASSANALAHTLIGLSDDTVTPVGAAVALQAARRIAAAWSTDEPDRAELALGALLAGWAVDHTRIGMHHALSQTAVRVAGASHAGANAALLPHTAAAMRARRPDAMASADADLGEPFEQLAVRLRDRAGGERIDAGALDLLVETVAQRPELQRVPPAPDAEELRALYIAASAP
jgi:alcohol dehydrogenase class IV